MRFIEIFATLLIFIVGIIYFIYADGQSITALTVATGIGAIFGYIGKSRLSLNNSNGMRITVTFYIFDILNSTSCHYCGHSLFNKYNELEYALSTFDFTPQRYCSNCFQDNLLKKQKIND